MQVTCFKVGYNFFNVLPAKDMYRAASVKSSAKFSHLVPSCRNTSSTVRRIILQLTLQLFQVEGIQQEMFRLEYPSCPLVH